MSQRSGQDGRRWQEVRSVLALRYPNAHPGGPRVPQDGPKMAPRWPQDGPKMAQDGPRAAQDRPRSAQDRRSWPEIARNELKIMPRGKKMIRRAVRRAKKSNLERNPSETFVLRNGKRSHAGPGLPQTNSGFGAMRNIYEGFMMETWHTILVLIQICSFCCVIW